jgi:hypothetical protein
LSVAVRLENRLAVDAALKVGQRDGSRRSDPGSPAGRIRGGENGGRYNTYRLFHPRAI